MDGAMSDAERCLCYHACLLGILNRGNHIAHIVQTAEDTSNICTLSLLNLVEELAKVLGTWTHAKTIQCTVKHVCLDTCLMERLCPLTDTLIGILAIEQVNLLKATTISFYTVKASHTDNSGCNLQ